MRNLLRPTLYVCGVAAILVIVATVLKHPGADSWLRWLAFDAVPVGLTAAVLQAQIEMVRRGDA